MSVAGLRQQLSPRVLYDDKSPNDRTGIPGRPADALVRGIVYALVCDGDNLPVIGHHIAKGTKTAPSMARHPGNTSVGREFDVVVGGVDPNQLVAVGY